MRFPPLRPGERVGGGQGGKTLFRGSGFLIDPSVTFPPHFS